MTILVADVEEGPHQHIDMVYALRPVAGEPKREPEKDHGWIWVTAAELAARASLPVVSCGIETMVADDVRELGIDAIRLVSGV
jgi:hypothetical protein